MSGQDENECPICERRIRAPENPAAGTCPSAVLPNVRKMLSGCKSLVAVLRQHLLSHLGWQVYRGGGQS